MVVRVHGQLQERVDVMAFLPQRRERVGRFVDARLEALLLVVLLCRRGRLGLQSSGVSGPGQDDLPSVK